MSLLAQVGKELTHQSRSLFRQDPLTDTGRCGDDLDFDLCKPGARMQDDSNSPVTSFGILQRPADLLPHCMVARPLAPLCGFSRREIPMPVSEATKMTVQQKDIISPDRPSTLRGRVSHSGEERKVLRVNAMHQEHTKHRSRLVHHRPSRHWPASQPPVRAPSS